MMMKKVQKRREGRLNQLISPKETLKPPPSPRPGDVEYLPGRDYHLIMREGGGRGRKVKKRRKN